jgi:CheY-like chemotaxis protein
VELRETHLDAEDVVEGPLESGPHIRFAVTDTGYGIAPDVMDKIFEPYFTTKTQHKGTGLGLSVAYGIIREHRGEIKVYSEPGKGTTFDVYLPLKEQAAILAEDAVTVYPTGTERILLVDDEAAIVRMEGQMLERLGYRVAFRTSSPEALEAFRAQPDAYDLVISDMSMPQMPGDQLAREVLAIRPDMPIIICTGFSERINAARAADVGVRTILKKPIIKAELARVVRDVLDGVGAAV